MNIIKKILLHLLLLASFTFGFVGSVYAQMPEVYPIYGYNEESNLCQIKQSSAQDVQQESLIGDYWSLRGCRVGNPEVFWNTGSGIAIWFLIILAVFSFNFLIYPKFKKRTLIEKCDFSMFELACIGIVLFFIVLLQHYFLVPNFYYDYGSDIDRIIYSNFIRPRVPIFYGLVYLVFALVRTFFLFLKKGTRLG